MRTVANVIKRVIFQRIKYFNFAIAMQYFIVAFVGAPFELWDLKNLHPLRTMPRKFPPITALEWSPLHNLKSLKRKMREEREKQVSSPTEGRYHLN